MKAAMYAGGGGAITIENLPDPVPGPDDVLIRVARCGICGTDLSMTKGEMFDFGQNTQFGHEYAGEVIEVGSRVDTLQRGDRVAVMPSVPCGQCHICHVHENATLCQGKTETAMVGFAEFARVPAKVATRLPHVLSLADGALVEPLAVSLYGLQLAKIRPGDPVLVLGGGTVALYAIYWARRLGAGRIVAMSRSARRKDMCMAMGADTFITFGDSEIGDVVEALGGSPHHVFECVGAPGMLQKAVMHVAPFGQIISLGFCTAPDPVMPALASYKCATMKFAVGYSMREFLYIADQLDKGHVDPKTIITGEFGLDDLPAAISQLRGPNNETKLHVCMGT